MNGFKLFFEQTKEQEKNLKDTLAKLPKSHRDLIKNYKIKWYGDNTLNGDDEHVGIINPVKKIITIAASYFFGREHVLIHEIGHKVFENFVTKELFEKWKKIIKDTKNHPTENPEELFCHAYSTYYCKNPVQKFNFPTWMKFIKELPK